MAEVTNTENATLEFRQPSPKRHVKVCEQNIAEMVGVMTRGHNNRRSGTPNWRPTGSRIFGGTDDDGAGSIAPHGKILPFEEDDAPYRRDHSPGGGRTLRGMRSLGPTAVSASSISRFLGLGACAVAAAGSIIPSITLTEPRACASSDVSRYSTIASSCSSDSSLIRLRCSTLCSRGTSSARILR